MTRPRDGHFMRTAAGLICLALAGCAGADASLTPQAAPPPAPAIAAAEPAPAVTPAPTATPRRRVNAAARGASAPPVPAEPDPADEGPMTRARAASQCWMKMESRKREVSFDKRADLVDACIKETMKNSAQ